MCSRGKPEEDAQRGFVFVSCSKSRRAASRRHTYLSRERFTRVLYARVSCRNNGVLNPTFVIREDRLEYREN